MKYIGADALIHIKEHTDVCVCVFVNVHIQIYKYKYTCAHICIYITKAHR